MVIEAAVWAIFLLPLGSFVLIAFLIRPFLNRWPMLSGLATIGALTGATGWRYGLSSRLFPAIPTNGSQ